MTEYLTTDDVIDLQIRAMYETNEEASQVHHAGRQFDSRLRN